MAEIYYRIASADGIGNRSAEKLPADDPWGFVSQLFGVEDPDELEDFLDDGLEWDEDPERGWVCAVSTPDELRQYWNNFLDEEHVIYKFRGEEVAGAFDCAIVRPAEILKTFASFEEFEGEDG